MGELFTCCISSEMEGCKERWKEDADGKVLGYFSQTPKPKIGSSKKVPAGPENCIERLMKPLHGMTNSWGSESILAKGILCGMTL